jgi:hypothetical protein
MFATVTALLPSGAATSFISKFITQITPDMPYILGLIAAGAAVSFIWHHFKTFASGLARGDVSTTSVAFHDFSPDIDALIETGEHKVERLEAASDANDRLMRKTSYATHYKKLTPDEVGDGWGMKGWSK